MTVFNTRVKNPPPLDYVTPPFPSLYWPLHAKPGVPNYLYYSGDIWRFTFYWTIIIFAIVHLAAASYAVLMHLGKGKKAWKWVWTVPLIYLIVAAIEAVLAGILVGLIIGAVYKAGYFTMSTWIPFVWALTNVGILILSSFSFQGGL